MTDRERKQREILEELVNSCDILRRQKHTKSDIEYEFKKALSELSKLDELDEKKINYVIDQVIGGKIGYYKDIEGIFNEISQSICQAYKQGKLRKE